jgi:hypothetical protein
MLRTKRKRLLKQHIDCIGQIDLGQKSRHRTVHGADEHLLGIGFFEVRLGNLERAPDALHVQQCRFSGVSA